jgi:hypothetical protein
MLKTVPEKGKKLIVGIKKGVQASKKGSNRNQSRIISFKKGAVIVRI